MIRLRVGELAEERGFNMSSLPRASDVSFTTVKRLWKKPYSGVNSFTLEKLAKALGVKAMDLFEEVPDEGENS
jgi:DNA-binding Xre family transcriptional regulator